MSIKEGSFIMSKLTDIADAVVEVLNGSGLSLEFTAERTLLPIYDLKTLKDLKVSVVPKGRKIVQGTRIQTIDDIQIDIGIQKKISTDSELDGLLKLVEDITALFKPERLTGFARAICIKKENDPIYDPDHLRQFRQFTSVVTLTFKVL
jgi:hypothetical protein